MDQEPKTVELSGVQQQALDKLSENDVAGLKALLASPDLDVNFCDLNGMTLLQHAAYKGNKDMTQMLIDLGADVNTSRHEHNYSALHFAALSGKEDVCVLLLNHGAKGHALNSVNRTPPQMAAFVGNHNCVAAINNFVPMSDVQYYIVPNGLDMDPKLPPVLAESFHKFITQVNVHPVAVLMSLQKTPALIQGHKQVRNVLSLMAEREIKRGQDANEVLSFKFHWLGMIFEDIEMTEESKTDKTKDKDVLDLCLKKFTKPSALDQFVRISVRRFPFIDSTLFRQVANGLATFTQDKTAEPGSSFSIITSAVNGQRGFASNSHCSACSNENASLQCSRCKKEVYCGTDCQKVHWHVHKRSCAPPSATLNSSSAKMKDEDKANVADLVAQQLSAQSLEVN